MPVLVILIFAMSLTSRTFAGNYTTPNDSVSSKVDAKRPQISPFNLSKETNTQQRFRKYDVNSTIKAMNEVLKRRKVLKPTFVVSSKQFPLSRNQKVTPDEAKKNRKRKRLRKIFSKHISNDLVFGVNATQMDNVNLVRAIDKVSEESRQSKIKFTDRMKELFLRQRILNTVDSALRGDSTFRHIWPIIHQELRNETNSKQLLQRYEASLSKVSSNELEPKMLQLEADRLQSMATELMTRCKTSRKGKSLRYKCHDRLKTVLNRISEREALKLNRPITLIRLLNRSKRHAKKSNSSETPTQTDDVKAKSMEAKEPSEEEEAKLKAAEEYEQLKETNTTDQLIENQGKLMELIMKDMFKDLQTEGKKAKEEQKKLRNRLDEKWKQFKTDVAKAVEVKTTSHELPRALNAKESETAKPDRFAAAELVPPRDIIMFRIKTTKAPCRPNDTLYALVIAFGICLAVLLLSIVIVACCNKTPPDPGEQERLIIFTKQPRSAYSEETVRSRRRFPRRGNSLDDLRRHSRHRDRPRRPRRRPSRISARHSYRQLPPTQERLPHGETTGQSPSMIRLQPVTSTGPPTDQTPALTSQSPSMIRLQAVTSTGPPNDQTPAPISQSPSRIQLPTATKTPTTPPTPTLPTSQQTQNPKPPASIVSGTPTNTKLATTPANPSNKP